MKKHFSRFFVLYLVFSFFLLSAIPSKTLAYVADSGGFTNTRTEDMAKVQRVLESKIVSGKLSKLGLSNMEINSRLEKLTDGELHQFASQIDSLYPGGDGLGVVIAILVIVILVIVILQLTGKKIIIKEAK